MHCFKTEGYSEVDPECEQGILNQRDGWRTGRLIGGVRRSLGDWSAMTGGCPLWPVSAGIKRFKHSGMEVVILMVKDDCLPFLLTELGKGLIVFKSLFRAIKKRLKGRDEEKSGTLETEC